LILPPWRIDGRVCEVFQALDISISAAYFYGFSSVPLGFFLLPGPPYFGMLVPSTANIGGVKVNKLLAMAIAALCAAPAAYSQEAVRPADMTKGILEFPTAKILKNSLPVADSAPAATFVNKKVAPGLVTWHQDYQQAVQAAKASGKPVLVLQMMGRLDEEFC
jgi:hypothetical protein